MKLQAFIFLLILSSSNSVFSGIGQDMVVTLTDTLYGEVQLDIAANKIGIRNKKNYQFLTASQVKWIRKAGNNYCVAAFGGQSTYFIFEVLSKGSRALLYREGVKFNLYDEEAYPPYFVLNSRSAYSVGTRKDVLSVFGSKEKEIKAYIKAHGLTITRKEDLSQIFDYYNKAG